MRKFHSYEEVNPNVHYYVPREELIERAYDSLLGTEPDDGGYYITVWGPRQSGKSWLMRQVVRRFKAQNPEFEVAILSMMSASPDLPEERVLRLFAEQLEAMCSRRFAKLNSWDDIFRLFTAENFERPLVLIIDEFDGMGTNHINHFARQFRSLYVSRRNETDKLTGEKTHLLHGLALIGVRSVLGIENETGSPFNVQRSLPIPNLTFEEVDYMFHWYERESGQRVEQAVIDRVFYETQGQPGLVGWFGELMTETFNQESTKMMRMDYFEAVYAAAIYDLPNNNVINLISKADQEPYRSFVLNLFNSQVEVPFAYDHKIINYLYMNGLIDRHIAENHRRYVKFTCPFVQKRLFNYFADSLFPQPNQLYDPFDDLSDTVTDHSLNLTNLMRRYEVYLRQNRTWLLKNAPRRESDGRVMEASYHFSLYLYLQRFFYDYKSSVQPEFPTGNGQIDLLIEHGRLRYGLEVKSFSGAKSYQEALKQAARYGKQLGLAEISLVFFCEYINEENREKYEEVYEDETRGVRVVPVFVATG